MVERQAYLEKIKPYMNTNLIKILVGIRRSGKSTLMKQIMTVLQTSGVEQNRIIYLNFEDFSIRAYKDPDKLFGYLKSRISKNNRSYVFLDEVQEVMHFEKVVNSLNATEDVDIYLTGSNSKLLSSELSTLLSGRYISFQIFPFSLKEMKAYHPQLSNEELFDMYIAYGGFPAIQYFENADQKRAILNDLYDSVVIKDIVLKHSVKNVDTLSKYISYLLNTVSNQFSAKNIINFLKNEGKSIAKETLYNYIRYAEEVFLIYSAKRYNVNGKRLLSTNEKYFVNDQGMRATRFNNRQDIEKILENIVYFELLRKGYDVYVGEMGDREIDFIAVKNGEKKYYQVAYIMEKPETRRREFDVYSSIQDSYPKYVLSMDRIDFSQSGIVHMNIIDFLLQ